MRRFANSGTPSLHNRVLSIHFPPEISVESVQVQLEKILASDTFLRSERLRRFLRFVVQAALQGRGDRLKEYLVGLEVFDRKDSYDPRTDSIVRVEAHRLRSKLQDYYTSQGREDRVLIDLPRGTYVPVFQKREPKASKVERIRPRRRSRDKLRTIAVLPFADLSPQRDQEYFGYGIADELISALMELGGLRVVSRTSATRFTANEYDARDIGRQLNADMVLQGSVRKAGRRVRITTHLINAADGSHLWSKRYDGEVKDVFTIQDEISRAVVNRLRVKLVRQQLNW